MRALAVLALTLLPTVALAQAGTPEGIKQAEVIATEALELFNKGDLVGAAERFLAAYELSGRHTQLRNAAKAFETAGKLANAIDAWERYSLHPEVEPDKRAQAVAHVVELKTALSASLVPLESKPAPDAVYAPPPHAATASPSEEPQLVAPAPAEAPSSALAWSIVGGGSAAVVAGAILYASGWGTYGSWTDSPANVTREEAESARTRSGIGLVVGGVGVAAVTAAVLFAFPDE